MSKIKTLNKNIKNMPHCNKQMISFFLTTRCNLRCVYCYNSKYVMV
jgi:MoaA/NifB/PqqE/SkfB family radical SAM enzyme